MDIPGNVFAWSVDGPMALVDGGVCGGGGGGVPTT